MATVNSGILQESNFMNLKEISLNDIRSETEILLVSGEQPIQAFSTVRDQVIFTNKRIIVINVRGITGKKVAYISFPYSKVQYFGIETAGLLDIDSELILAFSNGEKLTFDFKARVDIRRLSNAIASYVL